MSVDRPGRGRVGIGGVQHRADHDPLEAAQPAAQTVEQHRPEPLHPCASVPGHRPGSCIRQVNTSNGKVGQVRVQYRLITLPAVGSTAPPGPDVPRHIALVDTTSVPVPVPEPASVSSAACPRSRTRCGCASSPSASARRRSTPRLSPDARRSRATSPSAASRSSASHASSTADTVVVAADAVEVWWSNHTPRSPTARSSTARSWSGSTRHRASCTRSRSRASDGNRRRSSRIATCHPARHRAPTQPEASIPLPKRANTRPRHRRRLPSRSETKSGQPAQTPNGRGSLSTCIRGVPPP